MNSEMNMNHLYITKINNKKIHINTKRNSKIIREFKNFFDILVINNEIKNLYNLK